MTSNKAFYIGSHDGDTANVQDYEWNNIELELPSKNESTDEKEKKLMDFDEILPMIGEFGRYQKILFLYMIPFGYFLAFVYFTQFFLTLIPEEYHCAVNELSNMTKEERLLLSVPKENGAYSKCLMYDVNYDEVIALGIREANASWPVSTCRQGWSYNFSDIPYSTIATDLNWVCEDSALATYAQSIFFLGAIVGGLLFGWIADKFGRIPSLIACNVVGCLAGMTTAYMETFWQFALMRFIVGFAFDNCFTLMYILVLEYVGPKYRTFVANMSIALFFTSAACFLPWIAYYLADWKLLAVVTSAPLMLVILTPLLIPESARWLISQGQIEKSMEILQKMAISNKKQVSDETMQLLQESCLKLKEEEENLKKNYSILDLFRTPRLRRVTILLIVIWMSISLVFDGHIRNVGALGLDVFLTFSIACFTEFPADTFLTYTLDKYGRRWYACLSMVLSGVFSLLAAVAPVGVISASLAIAGRFFVNISYNVGAQYAAEILPTVVRGQGVAFIHIMGYVANIIAPFVVYLNIISTVLPLIILGLLGIFGGLLALLLPETTDQALPQTLQDGENFGRNQSFWLVPCLSKTNDDPEKQNSFAGQLPLKHSKHSGMKSNIFRRSFRKNYEDNREYY